MKVLIKISVKCHYHSLILVFHFLTLNKYGKYIFQGRNNYFLLPFHSIFVHSFVVCTLQQKPPRGEIIFLTFSSQTISVAVAVAEANIVDLYCWTMWFFSLALLPLKSDYIWVVFEQQQTISSAFFYSSSHLWISVSTHNISMMRHELFLQSFIVAFRYPNAYTLMYISHLCWQWRNLWKVFIMNGNVCEWCLASLCIKAFWFGSYFKKKEKYPNRNVLLIFLKST